MKILLVYPSPLSNIFFETFIDRFITAGHQVGVCTGQPDASVTYTPLPQKATSYEIDLPRGADVRSHVRAIHQLRRIVRAFDPDVVHAHMSASVFTTAMARTWPQPTIGTFHGLIYPLMNGFRRKLMSIAERAAIARLDYVQVVNKHDYELVRRDCPTAECTLLRAGFGCDLLKFDPSHITPRERVAARRELRLDPSATVGAFVGRLVSFKGIPILIRAFRRAVAEEPTARLLIIGDRDPLHETGLTREEEAWIQTNDAVRVTGFTSNPERYLAVADYFALPSAREGLSTAIMEAMCMGLPIVTTTARGCGDLIDPDQNGLLVAPDDERALAAAFLQTIRQPDRRRRQGAAALGLRSVFDRKACIDEMLGIYDRLAKVGRSDSSKLLQVATWHN